jgi:beta-lactamase regulating signal transducer with metallopeptidase domain
MTPAIETLHIVSPAVADLLVASMWQSVLLTGAVVLCVHHVRGMSAGTRFGLWTAVLVLIVLLPVISVLVPQTVGGGSRTVHLASDWSLALVCSWAVLSLFRAVQLCLGAGRLWTLARSARPVEVDATIAPLLEAASRRAVLCTSEQVDRPSVVGFFRPRILLPPDLPGNLSQSELEQIVLHEMEHLRRGDHWTNLLQQLSLVLMPWNPAVLWLNRQLCFERELACDDGVLRATKARKTYAACLVRLAEDSMLRQKISLALGVLGAFESRVRESELVTRVRRILATPEPGRGPMFLRAATATVLVGALGLSFLLARSPRLVDFATSPMTVAATGLSETQTFGPTLTVSRTEGAKLTLAKAVVSGPRRARPVVITTSLHKHAPQRRTLRAAESGPAIEMQVWRESVHVARPGITLTSAEDSQRLYAAVPWRGGWLLFQL